MAFPNMSSSWATLPSRGTGDGGGAGAGSGDCGGDGDGDSGSSAGGGTLGVVLFRAVCRRRGPPRAFGSLPLLLFELLSLPLLSLAPLDELLISMVTLTVQWSRLILL